MSGFCTVCRVSNTLDYDPVSGIEACTICGTVAESSSSTSLQVLGRVVEDEGREAGRTYLHGAGTGYIGAQAMTKHGMVGGDGAKQVYHEARKVSGFLCMAFGFLALLMGR
jgi:hypothetical protein